MLIISYSWTDHKSLDHLQKQFQTSSDGAHRQVADNQTNLIDLIVWINLNNTHQFKLDGPPLLPCKGQILVTPSKHVSSSSCCHVVSRTLLTTLAPKVQVLEQPLTEGGGKGKNNPPTKHRLCVGPTPGQRCENEPQTAISLDALKGTFRFASLSGCCWQEVPVAHSWVGQ